MKINNIFVLGFIHIHFIGFALPGCGSTLDLDQWIEIWNVGFSSKIIFAALAELLF
jgi:hypothetical protein